MTVVVVLECIRSITIYAAFPAHCRSPRGSLAGSYVLVKISRDKKSAKIDFAFCIFAADFVNAAALMALASRARPWAPSASREDGTPTL